MEEFPDFRVQVEEVLNECIELVEATLYQCALNPASTVDRIFYLKTRRPDVYGDKLRADQVTALREEGKRQAYEEIAEQLKLLPVAERERVLQSIFGARRELVAVA